jgi:hypothetical protein
MVFSFVYLAVRALLGALVRSRRGLQVRLLRRLGAREAEERRGEREAEAHL